ncbi:RsmD family RNA methyltransferase [Vicingaceae bacterium]|nr:RsmD family RNA methyltransferase [Vicingaceae bacterium]MDB4060780.1 RsmD family RNA methyltransferase [Vicingaceae bacterium]MDC1452416.1 RsmD family RNA methyltransferase [Vicingaceae bacterium]
MRIVSGTHKGRRFSPPKGLPVRPTTDFAKEGLFNMLRNRTEIEDTKVLDLCAGTGNMTFEFASRGASSVLAVDQHVGCIKFIKKAALELQLNSITALKADVFKFVNKLSQQYDIIFADPPYGLEEIVNLPSTIFKKGLLAEGGLLVLEHGRKTSFEEHPNFISTRKFGNVTFTFFEES